MFNPEAYQNLTVNESPIPSLFVIRLAVFGDNRGWFKENYQREKMQALGLPDFNVVQNNFSFNEDRGVTRGLHAEPWEKFISVANGKVFGAWVDLRKGPGFGKTFSIEINPGIAVFVPQGVANGYQTLEDKVTYTYLVNKHWSPDAQYTFINLFDDQVAIRWPISEAEAIVSSKDRAHPPLSTIEPLEIV